MFNFVANSASILSIASSAIEAGECAARNASQGAKRSVATKDIKDYTGDALLNKSSVKHNEMKNAVRKGDLLTGFHKVGGFTCGLVKGFFEGMKGNWLSTGFAAMTLAAKGNTSLSKGVKKAGLIGMTVTMLLDFIKNGTNLFTKKDIIEK